MRQYKVAHYKYEEQYSDRAYDYLNLLKQRFTFLSKFFSIGSVVLFNRLAAIRENWLLNLENRSQILGNGYRSGFDKS